MSALETAIAQQQEEVDSYAPGTPSAPKPGTSGWYLLRAAVLGLQYLKRVQGLEIHNDHGACERLYRHSASHFKAAVPPEAVEVVKETLPA